jgi:hypothetical protein
LCCLRCIQTKVSLLVQMNLAPLDADFFSFART